MTPPRAVILVLLAALTAEPVARAADRFDMDPARQALLLLRALAYDRQLKARAGTAVSILLVEGQDADAACRELGHELEVLARTFTVVGLPVRVRMEIVSDASALDARLTAESVSVLFVCDGSRLEAAAVTSVARRLQVRTATSTSSRVYAGIGLGIVTRGTRLSVLVNLPAARAEGADFDASLLAVADVLR